MQIRKAVVTDTPQLIQLFQNTILNINCRDYNTEQIKAWAERGSNADRWRLRLTEQYFIVATLDEQINGFASMTSNGYLDMLFVHKDYQRQGIAAALLATLENYAAAKNIQTITTDASITARPFFEKHGFIMRQQQSVALGKATLINFKMSKP